MKEQGAVTFLHEMVYRYTLWWRMREMKTEPPRFL